MSTGPERPRIIAITGIPGAGKSSLAQALAERRERSVHLRADTFRRLIVNGAAPVVGGPAHEELFQLRMHHQLAADAAATFSAGAFSVMVQDVFLGTAWPHFLGRLVDYPLAIGRRNVHAVMLAPRPDTVQERAPAWSGPPLAELDAVLREDTPRIGLWLDTTAMGVAEAADHVLAHLGEAVPDPAALPDPLPVSAPGSPSGRVVSRHFSPAEVEHARTYWTEERMRRSTGA
ncbi:broad-specificity NMP kinase [Murinocardiopsis flavida]|uniref:UDP-N-acetylglucosamine kinase n=1 Tax=Murinocardiopsis flavida TaxID=645275 RepID=A0A2P8DNZ7_9ACTN|nr:zeta toxin family protein [Murinocardiopsis flavida]PSK98940.1 broad-specificity NMP kinase [Murinocardiopsis flavida]